MIDNTVAYNALLSRDVRFDGVFFTGVTSTGIYCRPICPARTPKQENCRFFNSREAAEKESFRPCLRCRPELSPGNAPMDSARRTAHLIAQRLEEGQISDGLSIEAIARQFAISSRQLRRIVHQEFGTSPIELIQIRRLLLAKQLLTETSLPVIHVAFASGFGSLRRFNAVFRTHYKMPPTHFRKKIAPDNKEPLFPSTLSLQLAYRPPYNWTSLLEFLKARMIKGVEQISDDSYMRTVRLGSYKGWIRVTHISQRYALRVELSSSLTPVLPALLSQLRHLFDLNARPDLIAAHLMKDPCLFSAVNKNPGLRVPGAFDGFEMAIRAILGQQITVKAATTLSCRFAQAFGEYIETPFPELDRLTPLPADVSKMTVNDIAELGIISARAKCIIALAEAYSTGNLILDGGMNPELAMQKLEQLPGIGPWTAHYIAMRALRWPDAFVKEDIVVRKNLGGISAKQAEQLSQAWRPWCSYATLHIWNNPNMIG